MPETEWMWDTYTPGAPRNAPHNRLRSSERKCIDYLSNLPSHHDNKLLGERYLSYTAPSWFPPSNESNKPNPEKKETLR